jgi:ABC-type glycerol-3-phosphate transport system substrate-binding protein
MPGGVVRLDDQGDLMKGRYLIYVDPTHMFFFQPWALANGGTLLNADWTKSTLNMPQTIEAARFAQSLVLKGYSPKPGDSFDVVTEFAANNLAIFGCGRWLNPALASGTNRDSAYWFAGFRSVRGVVIGIDFQAGPLNAGLGCLGAVLMTVPAAYRSFSATASARAPLSCW